MKVSISSVLKSPKTRAQRVRVLSSADFFAMLGVF